MNQRTDRQNTIAGLRELADFLDANPGVPISHYARIITVVDIYLDAQGRTSGADRRAEVDRAAALMGVDAVDTQGGHYRAEKVFTGGVELAVASCDPGPKPGLCELCKTKPVHKPDAGHPQRVTARVCRPCLGDGPWDDRPAEISA